MSVRISVLNYQTFLRIVSKKIWLLPEHLSFSPTPHQMLVLPLTIRVSKAFERNCTDCHCNTLFTAVQTRPISCH